MRVRTTLLAALTVVLTSSALARVFSGTGWIAPVLGAVAVVAGAGLLARRLGVPPLLQPAVAVVLVAGYAALLDARSTLAWGLPTPETGRRLGALFGQGLIDVGERAAPAPTTAGLVLLAVLGVAAIAVLVDVAAVALRRPVAAGLPLLALFSVPSGTLRNGVGWLPFVLGASAWLALLVDEAGGRADRWGVALRGATGTRSPLDQSSLGRVGRRIGVAALGAAVVVPALVPNLDQRLFESSGGVGEGGARTTVTYNPLTALAGQLRLPTPRTLLTYSTTDTAPDYLRLTTLDKFDDTSGWSSSELSADVKQDAVSRGVPMPAAVSGAATHPLTATIDPDSLGGPWLPVPDLPTAVDVPGAWLWDRRSETVFSTRATVDQLRGPYRVSAARVLPDPAALRRQGALPPGVAPLAVPPKVSPYVRDLTLRVTQGAPTAYDKVSALQSFFRDRSNGFVYSEDTSVPGIASPNALEAFLRGRRGFCEQYASAMAAMVRELGIPARVGVGFTAGSREPDGSYQVTTSDAHAWPEVWFAGAGWVRFEPTPRGDQVSVPSYSVPPSTADDRRAAAPQQTAPAQPTARPGVDPDTRDTKRLPGDTAGAAVPDSQGGTPVLPIALGAAALALLATPALLARLRRRRLWRDGGPDAAWAHVVEDAVDVGHRWRSSETPGAAAQRLVDERRLDDEAAVAARRLAQRVQQARYARPDVVTAVPAEELRGDVRLVRAALLAAAPRRTRWVARALPPSALRWAATTCGRAAADVLDRLDAFAAQLGARVRRQVS